MSLIGHSSLGIGHSAPALRALTLHQPYASAIALGLKRIETRGWSTAYRGPVVIHAALAAGPEQRANWAKITPEDRAAFTAAGYRDFCLLPFMRPVAVAELVDILPVAEAINTGRADLREQRWGNYAPLRFAWNLRDIRPLARRWPIPVTGYQGLWHWRHGPLDLAAPLS